MQKIVDYLKQYIGVISIVFAVCVLLTYSLSHFRVDIDSNRAARCMLVNLNIQLQLMELILM